MQTAMIFAGLHYCRDCGRLLPDDANGEKCGPCYDAYFENLYAGECADGEREWAELEAVVGEERAARIAKNLEPWPGGDY